MKIEQILKIAIRGGASDIILKVGAVPRFRLSNQLISLAEGHIITPALMHSWLAELVPDTLAERLTGIGDVDFSYQDAEGYRFRINVFRQRQNFGMVLRVVSNHVRTIEELQLPAVVADLAQAPRGLVLVTGATGSGKSTTLAAMVERINTTAAKHIITIEDPIEYTYGDKASTINQREIGVDTESFPAALRSALRQNPDVILVGELRDAETVATALMAAETGHMVFSTLHTQDAQDSLTRLLSYFPPHSHGQVRLALSETLRGIISQRLLTRADKKGMVPVFEIMVANERIKEIIHKGDPTIIPEVISKNRDSYGMVTFDQSIFDLHAQGIISEEEALKAATNRKDFELLLAGVS